MLRTKTLDDITYKDKWYRIGSDIVVEDKDVEKLVRIGAIAGQMGGIISEKDFEKAKAEVKIKVIKNPVKPRTEEDKMFDSIATEIPVAKKLNKKETKEFIEKEILPKIKRRDKRKKSFRKRRR